MSDEEADLARAYDSARVPMTSNKKDNQFEIEMEDKKKHDMSRSSDSSSKQTARLGDF